MTTKIYFASKNVRNSAAIFDQIISGKKYIFAQR